MLYDLLGKITLFATLFQIDCEIATAAQRQGCHHCGGPLHQGGYARKARGELCDVPEAYRHRYSFCCGWCRQRCMPASVRFWGRRVYWGPTMILAAASRQGRPALGYAYLRRLVGVSMSTVRRWMRYFTEIFPYEARWVARRGHVPADVPNDHLPGALLTCMGRERDGEAALVAVLRFLAG